MSMRRLTVLTVALAVALPVAGCGRKAPPKAPEASQFPHTYPYIAFPKTLPELWQDAHSAALAAKAGQEAGLSGADGLQAEAAAALARYQAARATATPQEQSAVLRLEALAAADAARQARAAGSADADQLEQAARQAYDLFTQSDPAPANAQGQAAAPASFEEFVKTAPAVLPPRPPVRVRPVPSGTTFDDLVRPKTPSTP